MAIKETIKAKMTAWFESNAKQADEFWEIENLVKAWAAWAFFNRGIKPG